MRRILFIFSLLLCVPVTAADLDDRMREEGFVDVSTLGVKVRLMYASDSNFTGHELYGTLTKAWLHPSAADALSGAVTALREIDPSLRLLVKDAARPMSVQRKMYGAVRGTSKARYVSNPANGGGLHNYGLAVDVTLADSSGVELPMGTEVDHLGKEAHIDTEDAMMRSGILSKQEVDNRRLLRKVMRAGGFRTIRNEWWHFQMKSRSAAKRENRLLDF